MRGMLVALALAGMGFGVALAGEGADGAHPHFKDQGVLHWDTSLADALKTAAKENKLVLIEYGREA